jgi:hypothetical protein
VAEAEGRLEAAAEAYTRVADGWEAFGHVLARAQNLLGAGRTRAALGRVDEARAALDEAAATFRGLRATPLAEEAERLRTGLGNDGHVDPTVGAAEPAPAEADA